MCSTVTSTVVSLATEYWQYAVAALGGHLGSGYISALIAKVKGLFVKS